MATLPSLTRTIDDAFVTTWYEIRPEAIDNILDATPVWAALKGAGCMKTQVGGTFITRTIRYGEATATEIERGDTLPQGDPELETMAIWNWRTLATHVQRNMFDDQKNSGPSKIKDLVATKLSAAKDALDQKLESSAFNGHVAAETGKLIQGLNDMVPPYATVTTSGGTYGGISRPLSYSDSGNGVLVAAAAATNPWWAPKYLPGTLASVEDDLLSDMKRLYNSCHNNQEPPDLIITDQNTFEVYEEFAMDMSQIVKDESTRLADLGFEVLRFKGKPLFWTPSIAANNVLMLNSKYIEIVYDPSYWFDMTEWKPAPLQTDRIAHIVAFLNMFTTQPRRHGRLYYA